MGGARKGRSKARAPEEERDAERRTAAAAAAATTAEEDEGSDGRFFACYLLCSQSPRHKGHTYIGFTVNPRRRIRQHNGERRSGAWRTKRGRPWEMVLCIYGFPTNVAALQFEWAWQHPTESLAVRKAASSFKSLSGVANKIKLAYTMLLLPSWENLNLTVNFFSTKYTKYSAGCPRLPKQMRVNVCEMDELPCYVEGHVFNDDNNDDDDDIEVDGRKENVNDDNDIEVDGSKENVDDDNDIEVDGSKENVNAHTVHNILVKGVEREDMEIESSGSLFNWRVSEDFNEQIESTDSCFLAEHPHFGSPMLDTSVNDLTKEDTDNVRKVSTLDCYNWKVYKNSRQLTESEPFSPVESSKTLDEYKRISPSHTSMADTSADKLVQIHNTLVSDQSKEANNLRKVSTLDCYNWKVRKSSGRMTKSKEPFHHFESSKPLDEDKRISPSHDSIASNTSADKLVEDAHDTGRADGLFHWRNTDNCEQLLVWESSSHIDIIDQSSECSIVSPDKAFKSNCGDRLNQLLRLRGTRKASAKCVLLSPGCNVIDLSTPPSCKTHSGTEKALVCSEIIDLTDSPSSTGEY